VPRAKLAFVQRAEPVYPNNFIELYAPCGECGQVCSTLCADGQRHAGADTERVDFEWFEDEGGERGWQYQPPGEDFAERIFLVEDDYGNCTLEPDLEETGAEIFTPITIDLDQGCSCQLVETFTGEIHNESLGFTVRCGQCTCWEFYCGTCRCVPRILCVVLIEEGGATRYILEWDPDEHRWGTDDGDVRINLQRGEEGGCVIVPDITGYYGLDMEAVMPCAKESITNVFDPASDIVSFAMEDPEIPLMLIGSSLLQDCAKGPCDEATPCNDECGGHPDQLTVTIHEWSEPGDTSGYPVDCSAEVTVHFWQTADYYEAGRGVKYSCGYIGWLRLDDPCCLIKVELRAGSVIFYTPEDLDTEECSAQTQVEAELTTEECDPYFADSGELVGEILLSEICMGCADVTAYRSQVTVVE
jgi:hypothetical protein